MNDVIFSPARLSAVAATRLLDTPAESAFDDLTRMAALVTGAPLAFTTLVDDRRSFWKSTFGLPAEAPRENTVDESFCQYVIRSGEQLVIEDATTHPLVAANPSVEGMGVRAWAGFPLLAPDGEVLGSFCVVDTKPRTWSARDVEVLRTLAGAAGREISLRAALGQERLARDRAESLARTLQESLLPPELPRVAGVDFGAQFHPAGRGDELGGDFYDLFRGENESWTFIVGDVCGKGVAAAKVAGFTRYAAWTASSQTLSPGTAMLIINEVLIARSPSTERFVTAVLGTITARDGKLRVRLACAGHVPPVLRRADGTTETLEIPGMLLGMWTEIRVGEIEVTLARGDALIIATDGVTEARRSGILYGEAGLREVAAAHHGDASTMAKAIVDAALEYGGQLPADDIAVLVIRAT